MKKVRKEEEEDKRFYQECKRNKKDYRHIEEEDES